MSRTPSECSIQILKLSGLFWALLFTAFGCQKTENLPQGSLLDQWVRFDTSAGLADNKLWALEVDKKGRVWAGTDGHGVGMLHDETWEVFTTDNGLNDNTVLAIEEDQDGNLWFGTRKGYCIYDGISFSKFGLNGVDTIPVSCIKASEDGSVWIGTLNSGIFCIRDQDVISYSTGDSSGAEIIHSIEEDLEQRIWAVTSSGYYIIEENEADFFPSGFYATDTSFRSVYCDSNGDVWLGGWNSRFVTRYSAGNFMPFDLYTSNDVNQVTSICEDYQGNIWFSLFNGGLIRYDGLTARNMYGPENMPGYRIMDLKTDQNGRLYAASYDNGIVVFTPSVKQYIR